MAAAPGGLQVEAWFIATHAAFTMKSLNFLTHNKY